MTFAQSICTHYSSLSGRPDIFLGSGTLKKSGPKYGPEKSREQETGSLLFKKRRGQAASSLLKKNHTVFCSLLFSGPDFGPDFYKVPDTKKISGRPDKLE